ncbi:MAG: BatA domain-containing protein [Phycisphaerae bacterium]
MPFLHPTVFWAGLAAVSVPIVIHLLNRRRFRLMDWAAMQFLWESVRKNRRRLRIEELILLALRCLVLAVLATALARFTGCRAIEALPGGTESQTAVFLLDDSYSMGQRVGGGTIFSAATTDVAEQLEKLSQTDKVAILLTSGADDGEPFFKLTHMADAEVEQLSARLAGLTPSDGRVRLGRALAAAGKVFQGDKSVVRRLYLYGDFRRVDLAGAEESDAIRGEFEGLRKLNVEVVAMDFGRGPKNNLTIESMDMLDKYAIAGVPVRVRLEVRNHGRSAVRDVEVRLTAKLNTAEGLRDVELPTAAIDSIEPGSAGRTEVQVTCPHVGPAVVTATLGPDELAADNSAHLALDVRQVINVLAVDGRPDMSDPAESESFFFVHAIDPDRNGSEGAKVEVVSPGALGETPLAGFDLVVLLNVGELPIMLDANGTAQYPQLDALTEFVMSGGGLAIFTGDRVNLMFYNGPLYANGSGLSPYSLAPQVGDPAKRDSFFRLDPRSIASEGVLKVFRDFLAAGVDPTRFIRFYAFNGTNPTGPPPSSPDVKPPRVLAKFADEDNSPAIVARQVGRGTVLMFYTSATMTWNDWPADENGTYVAVLNDMLAYLGRPQAPGLSATVGEPVVFALPDGMGDATATLKTPLHPIQPVVPLVPVRKTDRPDRRPQELLRYERPDHAGTYSLELALPDETTRQVLFARNVDPAEGDLTCGREPALAAALGSEQFVYVDRTAARPHRVEKPEVHKEYWTWALALLALLLAAETFLGQRFGHYAPAAKRG